jgi:hypothetical protein
MWAPLAEPCALDILPAVRSADREALKSAVDCSVLEIPPLEPKDKVKPLCLLGMKKVDAGCSARGAAGSARGSNFRLNLRTWSKLLFRFNLVMGRVVGKLLGRSAGSGLGLKSKKLRLGRLLPKPKLIESFDTKATKGSGPVSDPVAGNVYAKCCLRPPIAHGSSLRPEMSSAADYVVVQGLSTPGGGSRCLLLHPAVDSAKPFVFPPLPTPEMLSFVSLDAPPAPVSSFVGFGSSSNPAPFPSSSSGANLTFQLTPEGASQPIFAPPPPLGAAVLGEKIRCCFLSLLRNTTCWIFNIDKFGVITYLVNSKNERAK